MTIAIPTVSQQDILDRRVMIYGMNYRPELTSTGRYSGEIGAALAARGVQVEVISAPQHYPGWYVRPQFRKYWYSCDFIGAVRVFRCPLMLRRDMRGVWRLLAPLSFAATSTPIAIWRLLWFRPHVLFCVEPTLFSNPVAALVARMLGIRTVLHVQDLEIDVAFEVGHLGKLQRVRGLALAFERATYKLFNRIVTISNAMRGKLLEKGVAPEKLYLVRNWVDLDQIQMTSGANAYRAELGIADSTLVVEYAGNIGAKQALEVLLDAAEALADEPELMFVIVGDGPAKPSLIKRYGHLANVRFLEPQAEERLCELLNFADLHVLPQLSGAADLVLPSKLGGMLASGKPIIVTASPDQELGEFLEGAAMLTPPGDSVALAAAIAEFSRNRVDPSAAARAELVKALSADERLEDLMGIILG